MCELGSCMPSPAERAAPLTSTPAVPPDTSGSRPHLAKVRGAGSSPVVRSAKRHTRLHGALVRGLPTRGAHANSRETSPGRDPSTMCRPFEADDGPRPQTACTGSAPAGDANGEAPDGSHHPGAGSHVTLARALGRLRRTLTGASPLKPRSASPETTRLSTCFGVVGRSKSRRGLRGTRE